MGDTEKRTRIARALGIAEGWMVADGVDMSTSTNPRIVRLMGLADVAIEAAGDDATIATLRRDILRLEGDRDAAMQSARLAQEAVERFVVAGEKVRADLAAARNDLDLERMTRRASEYVERAINHGGHRFTTYELRSMAEMSPESDAAHIIADLLATRDRLAAFAEMEHARDEALKAAHLARETATRELAADRRAVMDALGGGITDASLKERILALRAERDEYRGELATILAERDAAVSMGTQLERDLAARTEEMAKARMALRAQQALRLGHLRRAAVMAGATEDQSRTMTDVQISDAVELLFERALGDP